MLPSAPGGVQSVNCITTSEAVSVQLHHPGFRTVAISQVMFPAGCISMHWMDGFGFCPASWAKFLSMLLFLVPCCDPCRFRQPFYPLVNVAGSVTSVKLDSAMLPVGLED